MSGVNLQEFKELLIPLQEDIKEFKNIQREDHDKIIKFETKREQNDKDIGILFKKDRDKTLENKKRDVRMYMMITAIVVMAGSVGGYAGHIVKIVFGSFK